MSLTVKDYLEKVEKVRDLPTLPVIFTELANMLSDTNSSVHDVEHLMESAQSLTMRVLKVANSAYYRVSDRVTNIGEAVNYLGFDKLKKVALSSSILSIFKGRTVTAFDINSFWKHGVGVAVASGTLVGPTQALAGAAAVASVGRPGRLRCSDSRARCVFAADSDCCQPQRNGCLRSEDGRPG